MSPRPVRLLYLAQVSSGLRPPSLLEWGVDDEIKLTPELLEQLRRASASQTVQMTRYGPCLCGKLLDIVEWERKWHSGRFKEKRMIEKGINYTDLLCGDCRKEFAKWPRIVCLGCRSLMGFYKPGKQSTGFAFEQERHYHILDCPKCNPARRSTPVLEHEQFCRARGIKTVMDLDLIQEIEQKVLQAEVEAARLRAEYEASKRQP